MNTENRRELSSCVIALFVLISCGSGQHWHTVQIPWAARARVDGASTDRALDKHRSDKRNTFLIDKYEVIIREYRLCVRAHGCPDLQHRPGMQVFDDEIVALTLAKAEAFCAWRGGHIPSNGEWEAAAHGPGGSVYPWGDQFSSSRLTEPTLIREYDTGYTLFRRSNSVDSGSPFGVHDTAGTWAEFTIEDGVAYVRGAPHGSFSMDSADFSTKSLRRASTDALAAIRCAYAEGQ